MCSPQINILLAASLGRLSSKRVIISLTALSLFVSIGFGVPGFVLFALFAGVKGPSTAS